MKGTKVFYRKNSFHSEVQIKEGKQLKKAVTFLFIGIMMLGNLAFSFAEEEQEKKEPKGFFDDLGSWISDTAGEVADWGSNAANDVADWGSNAAKDVSEWTVNAANDVANWTSTAFQDVANWTSNTANGTWAGITGFFNPPSTVGTPSIVVEPEFPDGTLKMYLGYPAVKTGLDNGYHNELEIGKNDPHYGMTLGKFYVSGFAGVKSDINNEFIFLKTVGDEVQLHFELIQDIDMLGKDTLVTINQDVGAYDRQFNIQPTDFGRGTLIVQFTDYQNNTHEPQIYTDFLSAKMAGSADTVISLNEEGDYEVALDYEIKKDSHILGTAATNSAFTDYRIHFKFKVRNGNCMVFPFDLETGEELKNTSIAKNGFRLDLAYSRYLDINVKRSILTESSAGMVEDIRFNRPARDGEKYDQPGIYTITVQNQYTEQETTKTIYVGDDQQMIDYVAKGYNLEQILEEMNTGT